jgi:uncharacterized protein with HEPN domain
MNKREYGDYVQDIFDSICDIENFTKGLGYDQFADDRKTVNAVVRSVEVIGEASKNIPEEIKGKYSKIDWKGMAGMRDKLIHEYFGVDLEILWKVVKEDIPGIKPAIEQMLKEIV